MRLYVPKRRRFYKGDCVSTAIASLTGKSVEEVADDDPTMLDRGMTNGEMQITIKKYGLPLKPSFKWLNRRLATGLPLGHSGLVQIRQGQLGSHYRHVLAFDGKLVFDNNVERATWVYDHRFARCQIVRIYLFSEEK